MMEKINVLTLIVAHIRTLKDHRTDRYSKRDIGLFIFVPIMLGFLSYYLGLSLSGSARESLSAIYAVFAALLLSAQIGLLGLRRNRTYEDLGAIERNRMIEDDKAFNSFLRSLSANISFLIFLSVVFLLAVVLRIVASGLKEVLDATLLTLSAMFFINLLMVIKRVFVAFDASYE